MTRQDLRSALQKVESAGELVQVDKEIDPLIEMPAVVRGLANLAKIPTLLFNNIKGYKGVMGCAAFFADRTRVLRTLGLPLEKVDLNRRCEEALGNPLPTKILKNGSCKENIHLAPCDIRKIVFPTRGAFHTQHEYYHPVVITKHPLTGVVNMAVYRSTISEPGKMTVNLRITQHGGCHLEAAKEAGVPLQVALCLGVHPAIYVAAVAQLPTGNSEISFAGALLGEPLELVRAETLDLEVPAHAEVVIEGEIRPPYTLGTEGPWPEYFGYLGMAIHPPVMDITAITHRDRPINTIFIPAAIPTIIGIANEAMLLRALRGLAGDFVRDVAFTPGSARQHHVVIKVRKTHPHHEGYQINVALAAFGFGTTTAIDTVTLVDEDIDITNYSEIDWAITTRCNPATQIHILPEARTHQNNPIAGVKELYDGPITKAKMITDATIPWSYRVAETAPGITFFSRSTWPEVDLKNYFHEKDLKHFSGQ